MGQPRLALQPLLPRMVRTARNRDTGQERQLMDCSKHQACRRPLYLAARNERQRGRTANPSGAAFKSGLVTPDFSLMGETQ